MQCSRFAGARCTLSASELSDQPARSTQPALLGQVLWQETHSLWQEQRSRAPSACTPARLAPGAGRLEEDLARAAGERDLAAFLPPSSRSRSAQSQQRPTSTPNQRYGTYAYTVRAGGKFQHSAARGTRHAARGPRPAHAHTRRAPGAGRASLVSAAHSACSADVRRTQTQTHAAHGHRLRRVRRLRLGWPG